MKHTFWNVMIDIGFWTRLTQKKIDEYKLDAHPRPLTAKYRLSNKPDKLSILSIDAYSFGDTVDEEKSGPVEVKICGQFINYNTVEEFNNTDIEKQETILLNKQKEKLRKLLNGEQVDCVTEIKLLIFGDFKKHTFKYQFLSAALSVEGIETLSLESAQIALKQRIEDLNAYVKHYISKGKQVPQFVTLKGFKVSSLKEFIEASDDQLSDFIFAISDTTNFGKHTGYHTYDILSLFVDMKEEKIITEKHLKKVQFLLMKEYLIYSNTHNYGFQNSQLWTVDLSNAKVQAISQRLSHPKKHLELDLKSFMDDHSLAREAVDLNIKLMKWRLLPTLNIEKIKSKRCLLFGAGTLGCQLARNLIGWGFKDISFIDYSKVSYSNPVRQTLYDFEDTIKGGKPKAQTAAEKLKKIYPEIISEGYNFQIPMPGHFVTKQEHIKETFETLNLLEKLVSQHDVLFLLLDSRQARWLPTVLANKYNKACITVGLGFDSFVIVRHGVPPQLFEKEKHTQRICCYFCNDIVTPQNTMKDRTLDQMCTVTRPGLSFLASAYASQLYVSLIHHPQEHHACANENPEKLQQTELGKLPHHIRGNMSDFETHLFYGRAFDQCVACSKFILDEYNSNREEFMMKVLNDPSFIHQVVHLQEELQAYQNNECGIVEIVDDNEFEIIIPVKKQDKKQKSETQSESEPGPKE